MSAPAVSTRYLTTSRLPSTHACRSIPPADPKFDREYPTGLFSRAKDVTLLTYGTSLMTYFITCFQAEQFVTLVTFSKSRRVVPHTCKHPPTLCRGVHPRSSALSGSTLPSSTSTLTMSSRPALTDLNYFSSKKRSCYTHRIKTEMNSTRFSRYIEDLDVGGS